VYERGDFVPVHVIGDGFGQRPGESQPDQLGRPPVVELALVDDLDDRSTALSRFCTEATEATGVTRCPRQLPAPMPSWTSLSSRLPGRWSDP